MMKRVYPLILAALGLILILAACQTAVTAEPTLAPTDPPTAVPDTATALPQPTATIPAPVVLTLTGLDGSQQTFTMEDLQALPITEGMGGIKSSTGAITLPELYRGVAVKDLLPLLGGIDETMGVNLVAEDGYAMTFSYDQLVNGNFISYDPANGDELNAPPALTPILAFERAGQPLDAKSDGQLRLVIVSEEGNQVTDGHWSVKWVAGITVKSLVQDWDLALNGTLNEVVDRSTFESCANCHRATYTDDKAQEWVGVPLWLLAGYVDDAVKHEGPAFNDAMAQTPYTLELIAADGYSVSFDSSLFARNNDLLVAFSVNGNPLEDKHFPLRLVGTGIEKGQMVGQIVEIKLNLEGVEVVSAEPAAEPTAEPAGDAAFNLLGLVDTPLALNEEDLRAMEVVALSLEHPKKGAQDYEGVRLSELLAAAGVQSGATRVIFTASDGYTVEADLAAVQACADCLVTFTDTPGLFNLAMPGFESSFWLKEVVSIEIK